jgi:hypothetical protein
MVKNGPRQLPVRLPRTFQNKTTKFISKVRLRELSNSNFAYGNFPDSKKAFSAFLYFQAIFYSKSFSPQI